MRQPQCQRSKILCITYCSFPVGNTPNLPKIKNQQLLKVTCRDETICFFLQRSKLNPSSLEKQESR